MHSAVIFSRLGALVLIAFYASGCMTIFGRQSGEENIYFDSNVEGTEVICSGKRIRTPGFIPLKKSKSHNCTAQLEGYEKKVFQIKSIVSGKGFSASTAANASAWGWWTLGAGLVAGWAVDAASGSMKNLKTNNIYLEMQPQGSISAAEKVFDKTVEVSKAVIQVPTSVVTEATQTVVDTTIRGGAEKLGVSKENVNSESKDMTQPADGRKLSDEKKMGALA